MKKILFTDLDDTLLTRDKRLTQQNASSIRRLLDEGHYFAASTGRPLPATLPLLRSLGLDRPGCFAVTYNGGLIYDVSQNKVLFKRSVPLAFVKHIFTEADRFGLYCQTYDDETMLCRSFTEETDYYCKKIGMDWKAAPDLPEGLTNAPVKVLVISLHNRSLLEQYRKSLEPWAKGKISLYYSNDSYLEHVACGISKGEAVRFLCRHLNLPCSHAVAAGDAENDIPMLQAAGIGAAMQNAGEEVKRAADYVTSADCDHSGICEVIEKFILF